MSQEKRKIRPDIRCVSMSDEIWEKAKQLAEKEDRSVSSFLRSTIQELHIKKGRNTKKATENLSG